MAHAFFGLIALTYILQTVASQCVGNVANNLNRFPNAPFAPGFGPNLPGALPGPGLGLGLPGAGLGLPAGANSLPRGSTVGGSFAVTSASPIPPTGVSVLAENLAIEGPLNVGGQLPFLGTVSIEGTLPGGGSGSVNYGCGGGNIGITGEVGPNGVAPYGAAGGFPYSGGCASPYGPAGPGYRL